MLSRHTRGIMARGPRLHEIGRHKIRCPNCDKYNFLMIDVLEDGDTHICKGCWKLITITLGTKEESLSGDD